MGLFKRGKTSRAPGTTPVPDAPGKPVPAPPPAGSAEPAAAESPATVADGDRFLKDGDVDAAQAAYERAEAGGDVAATLKLAALMEDYRKDTTAAEAAWRRADEAGDLNGSGNLGRVLKERGDLRGAEAAFRRCAEAGSLRATIDAVGLMSLRTDVTAAEVTEGVVALCPVIDADLRGERMLGGAEFVLDGVLYRCDVAAVEAGLRIADERGSGAGSYYLGFQLWNRQGRRADAAAAYHRSAQRGYAEAWAKAAGGYLELGDIAMAEAVAREGDAAGVAVASTMLGMVLDQKGDTDGGLEAYRRADAGGEATGSFNLGIELEHRGDHAGALAALTRAEERGAEGAAKARRAIIRAERMPELDAAARREGESLWAWGVRLEAAGDEAGSIFAYVEALSADEPPDSPQAKLFHARWLDHDDDPRAEAAFAQLLEAEDAAIRATALGAVARFHLRRGESDEALVLLRRVVETDDPEETPRALRNIGAVLDERGDRAGAREAYRAAIDLDHPEHTAGAMVNVALSLAEEGDAAGAAQMYREAIETGHEIESPRARVLLGIMVEEQGNSDEALEWWESAIGSPDQEWTQRAATNAAGVYYLRGNLDKAAELFRVGSEIEPPDEAASALYLLAECERMRGNTAAAVDALTRAATLASGQVRADVLALLERLR